MKNDIVKIDDLFEQGLTAPDIVNIFMEKIRKGSRNEIDMEHYRLLVKYNMYLKSNDFLNLVSSDLAKFRKSIVKNDKEITLTMRGRIKSIVRMEEKFNGYIVEFCDQYYSKNGCFPGTEEVLKYLERYRDLIAYRIILSVPEKNLKGRNKQEEEIKALYRVANSLPGFFRKMGYTIEDASTIVDGSKKKKQKSLLLEENQKYFKDYVQRPKNNGYQSLHISMCDNRPVQDLPIFSSIEVQLRTFQMDCAAEMNINSKHEAYEEMQEKKRTSKLPEGKCEYYDNAVVRYNNLHNYDFTHALIDHFKAIKLKDGTIVYNDHAGVRYGREIDPREYL